VMEKRELCHFRILKGKTWFRCQNQVDTEPGMVRCYPVCRTHKVALARDNRIRFRKGINMPTNFDVLDLSECSPHLCRVRIKDIKSLEEEEKRIRNGK
jgi:hypothetical protein